MSHHHRSGSLKQSNKKHKTGGDSSKREVKRGFGSGKVEKVQPNRNIKTASTTNMAIESKFKRTARDQNARKQDRLSSWMAKRTGSTSNKFAPKCIVFIPLNKQTSMLNIPQSLIDDEMPECEVRSVPFVTNAKIVHSVVFKRHKLHCSLIQPEYTILDTIEAIKIADVVVFVSHADENTKLLYVKELSSPQINEYLFIDELGHRIVAAIKALGMPECIGSCISGITSPVNVGNIRPAELKNLMTRHIESFVINTGKIFEYEVKNRQSDCEMNEKISGSLSSQNNHLIRFIKDVTVTREQSPAWRQNRSYVICEDVEVITQERANLLMNAGISQQQAEKLVNSVKISGFIRGNPLYLHSLLHIPNVGTGKIIAVRGKEIRKRRGGTGDTEYPFHFSDASKIDSTVTYATPDPLQGEQTWPTEEELNEYDNDDQYKDTNNKIYSKYHNEWFEEDDDGEDEEDGEGNGDVGMDEGDNDQQYDDGHDENGDGESVSSLEDNNMDEHSELRVKLAKPAKTEDSLVFPVISQAEITDSVQFPDEIDSPLPPDSLRAKYTRYRALKSIKTCDWHPKENLPQEYGKIFQFSNFPTTQRRELERVLEALDQQDNQLSSEYKKSDKVSADNFDVDIEAKTNSVLLQDNNNFCVTGSFVELYIEGVDATSLETMLKKQGFLAGFVLFKHEVKTSVVHINFNTVRDMESYLRNKNTLIFQFGFRSMIGCKPVFSESSTSLRCNRTKMLRYVAPGNFTTASVFAPVTYTPCPVLIYAYRGGAINPSTPSTATAVSVNDEFSIPASELELVATGMVSAVDPDRIILKRAIFTGDPIRAKKCFGVVKHMFFDPVDVKYYKPAELFTKNGLRGHITEPVGTHGLFKAHFSAPIKQNDTVMLVLYKRVYPKPFNWESKGKDNLYVDIRTR